MKNIFAQRLSELIEASGKTQNIISRELQIPKQKLSNWKLSHVEPDLDDILMLALYFDVSSDYLLGLEDDTGTRIAK